MAFARLPLLLVAFPLLVLFYSIFLHPQPPPQRNHHHHDDQQQQQQQQRQDQDQDHKDSSEPLLPSPPKNPTLQVFGRAGAVDSRSVGGKFHISFCSSGSYKKRALETRAALMNLFVTKEVALSDYPRSLSKRVLIMLLPVAQFTGITLAVGAEHLFPGYTSTRWWHVSLQYAAAACFFYTGTSLQDTLQNTGAFEVYFDGHLIFSKLKEGRFPDTFELTSKSLELELRELHSTIHERKTEKIII